MADQIELVLREVTFMPGSHIKRIRWAFYCGYRKLDLYFYPHDRDWTWAIIEGSITNDAVLEEMRQVLPAEEKAIAMQAAILGTADHLHGPVIWFREKR